MINNSSLNVAPLNANPNLDACGYTDTGNKLIGYAIIGLLDFALISLK